MLRACRIMTAVVLPPPMLRWILRKKLKFLRKCQSNDIIPEFLRFRVPENGVFSDQAVHSFQLKLLRTEINQARSEEKKIDDDLAKAREVVRRGMNNGGPQ